MLLSLRRWVGLLILSGVTALSAAEPLKIAVVDMARVFDDYYKTRIVQSQLEEQQSVYRTHVTAMNEEYNKLQDEYKVLLDAAQNITLKESERQEKAADAAKKLAEVRQKERDINQYLTEKSRQFKELEDTKRTEITAEILGEVQRRATVDGYDMVLDYSGKTTSNLAGVVFFKPNLDITDAVLEELNRGNNAVINQNKKD